MLNLNRSGRLEKLRQSSDKDSKSTPPDVFSHSMKEIISEQVAQDETESWIPSVIALENCLYECWESAEKQGIIRASLEKRCRLITLWFDCNFSLSIFLFFFFFYFLNSLNQLNY